MAGLVSIQRVALAVIWAVLAVTGACLAAAPAHADCRIEADCTPGDGPLPRPGGVPQDVLTGTFSYPDTFGVRPIAGATVEVWTEEPRGIFNIRSWDKRHTTRTASDGSLRVSFAHKPGVNVKYALRVFASNDAAIVMPGTAIDITPFYVEPPSPNGSPHYVAGGPGSADFSTTFRDPSAAGRFNIADAMRHGQKYAAASRAAGETEELPPVKVQITPAESSSQFTWFLVWDEVQISSNRMFEDRVVLHEYGHHVQHKVGVVGDGGKHNGCTFENGSTATKAFQEAWASAFATATDLRSPGALDTRWFMENPQTCTDLPAGTPGDTVEFYVWGALWDLLDATNEPGDSFTRQDLVGGIALERLLIEIVDRELDAPDRGMLDFRTALIARGADQARLDELLRHNRVLPQPAPIPPVPPTDPGDVPDDDEPLYCRSKPWMCN